MPRPSLSASPPLRARYQTLCVAGVDAPAFVERASRGSLRPRPPGVAGVDAPAFVERS